MDLTQPKKRTSSKRQRRLGIFLLVIPVLIMVVILVLQNRFDIGAWRDQTQGTKERNVFQADMDKAEGLMPISSVEAYDRINLSDKINGKADLYLSAGFRSLESRRFALTVDNTRWMERYVYDMGGHRNAFAVYSAQRRPNSEAFDLTPHAYRAANGLFFVSGPYYVEMIAAESSDLMLSRMEALAAVFMKSRPAVASEKLPELSLFPPENLQQHTPRLIADSAFGIKALDWVYTANYSLGQGEAMAFIAKRASGEKAHAAAKAFMAYWNEYGAQSVKAPDHLKTAQIVTILDNYEIAMVHNEYFFGVHEAVSLETGLELAARLLRAIEGAGQ